ncbi:MAG: hypothetical protein JSU66_02145 [Deltaproteobacteria bacterium]|nr:MAG: hypothetical protein JSU66_02145 [Deltaproteobacteria bacterium]
MSHRTHLATLVGFAFVAATLSLVSPGVRIARAQDAPAGALESRDPLQSVEPRTPGDRLPLRSSAPPGPSCSVASADAEAARMNAVMLQLRRELQRNQAPGSAEVRVLNARGYNYGSDVTGADPRKLRLEALQQP